MIRFLSSLGLRNLVVILICALAGIIGGCAIQKSATKPVNIDPRKAVATRAQQLDAIISKAIVVPPPTNTPQYYHWDVKALFGSNAFIATWPYRIGNQTLMFDVEISTNMGKDWLKVGTTNWNVYPLVYNINSYTRWRVGQHFE